MTKGDKSWDMREDGAGWGSDHTAERGSDCTEKGV